MGNEKCDVWSIGVTVFVMSVASFPWNSKNDLAFIKLVTAQQPKYQTKEWGKHPAELISITKKLLEKEHKLRPGAKGIEPEVAVEKWGDPVGYTPPPPGSEKEKRTSNAKQKGSEQK